MPVALLTRDRSTLDAFLSRVQSRGDVSPLQADAIRSGWESGDQSSTQLPLDESTAIQGMTDDAIHAAALVLLALAPGGHKLKDANLQTALEAIAAWRLRQLLAYHEQAQDEFEHQVAMIAPLAGTGLNGWHTVMIGLVVGHLAQQAILGSGGNLGPADVDRLGRAAHRETRYLLRFADDVALAGLNGKPKSESNITHRGQLYAGAGRTEFYQSLERHPELWPRRGDEQQGTLTTGWVAEYVALDDDSTCVPCHESQGFYLPTEGPYPGTVCFGRARCRCRRVLRWLPKIHAELTENRAAGITAGAP